MHAGKDSFAFQPYGKIISAIQTDESCHRTG